jgi:WD40 repeat protein
VNISAKLATAAAAVLVGLIAGVALLSRDSAAPTTGGPPQTGIPHAATSPSTRSLAATAPTASPAATLGGERIGASAALVGPAGNGLVAYSSDGDIFVGDPTTGSSTAIVTGPSNDTRPIFSPDGLRITFLRAESEHESSIVVVRADGSDEHVVMAEGFTDWFPGFAWTPDSTSILVNHDTPQTPYFDGELSLFDATGVDEPRLITPPLPAEIGYTYFSIHDPVAPMFQPPTGDAILSYANGVLSVVDLDGSNVEGFVTPSLTEFEPYLFTRPAWSRDGSLISFGLYSDARLVPFEEFGLFVIDADGSDLRRFETAFLDRAWSPDSSKIALEKSVTVSARAGSVIAILDVNSGAERVLDATAAVEKDMANRATDPDAFRTYSIRTEHRYAYEGWSWTPDGRSIVVLERHGTRPFFVDIETGHATELPWEADSALSWQRVPAS